MEFNMVSKIKKLFFFLFIVLSQVANATPTRIITNYLDLLNSVSQGDSVRAIMFINKCSMTKTTLDSNDVIASMNFTNFNKYKVTVGTQQKNTIATSMNTLVEHSKLGTVYNYVRLRIFDDNSAEIFSEYLDPTTYKQLGSMTANCAVSNGHDQNGIVLFDGS